MVDTVHNEHPGLLHAWHPVARSDEVTGHPTRVLLLGQPWVLVRLPELTALADRCPHRAAPLSAGTVVGGSLQCPYHGWAFGSTGRCTAIPALGDGPIPPRSGVTAAAAVAERFGLVWIAPLPPVAPLPEVPEWNDPAFTVIPLGPFRSPGGVAPITDNFLDLGHFPFLHAGTFGAPDDGVIPEYRTERDGWTVRFSYEAPWQHPDGSIEHSVQHYEVTAPFALWLRMEIGTSEIGTAGRVKTILFFCQPETGTSSRLYKILVYNDVPTQDAIDESAAFETAVVKEDLAMIELLPDDRLPLRPDAERHTRADRSGLAWRQVLAELLQAGPQHTGSLTDAAVPA